MVQSLLRGLQVQQAWRVWQVLPLLLAAAMTAVAFPAQLAPAPAPNVNTLHGFEDDASLQVPCTVYCSPAHESKGGQVLLMMDDADAACSLPSGHTLRSSSLDFGGANTGFAASPDDTFAVRSVVLEPPWTLQMSNCCRLGENQMVHFCSKCSQFSPQHESLTGCSGVRRLPQAVQHLPGRAAWLPWPLGRSCRCCVPRAGRSPAAWALRQHRQSCCCCRAAGMDCLAWQACDPAATAVAAAAAVVALRQLASALLAPHPAIRAPVK